jgi:hypothetical protein
MDRSRQPTTLTLRPFAGDLFVLYEVLAFNAYHIASSLLLPDDVRIVVDCGANIGITSLFLAARYPRAKILSVEPHPENFALLKANVAAVPRIVPIGLRDRDVPKYSAIHYQQGCMGKLYQYRFAWRTRSCNNHCGSMRAERHRQN